jgi:methionyl-tRNA formyltransferase
VQHAIWHGDDITGASTFILEEGMDTGPVIGVVTEAIGPHDTSGDLLTRLANAGAQLLVASLDGLADGSVVPVAQPAEGVSLAPKIEVADALVDFSAPAVRVDRQVRACTPAPGAWTTFRGDRLGLDPVVIDECDVPLAPGVMRVGKRAVWVGTATGSVRLSNVRPAGKKAMAAADWARGVRIGDSETLG